MDELLVVDTTGREEYPSEALGLVADLPVRLVGRQARSEAEIIDACTDAHAILVTSAPITRRVLEALPELRAVVRYGVGLDNIDLQAARELGVAVRNVTDFCTDEVADHTLALVLALARRICAHARATRDGRWRGVAGSMHRLAGRRAGVLGFGAIGRAVARRLQALGMEVVSHDPFADEASAAEQGITLVPLQELLATSHVVTVNCPLTDETHHLIGEAELAAMKPTALLVNTARGEIIDEAAVARALEGGEIAGAGLDVLETEPPSGDNPLLASPDAIVTPHVGWASEEAAREVVVGAFRQLADALRDTAP